MIVYYGDLGSPQHDALVLLDNLGAQTTAPPITTRNAP
jgi:hypothetical protein